MIYQHPVELLQHLIRFDTTNPPGNENACINYIGTLLQEAGIDTQIYTKLPDRPNLIARLPGTGNAPPLLLYGHVDVVTVANQDWTQPPFGGDIVDGFVWGRGTLDMKGGVAMMLAAFLRAKAENLALPGDVIFLALADEEFKGTYGAEFLVDEHPELFEGVRYAIGEVGGYTKYIGDQKFYLIQVAEKQGCATDVRIKGPGGHGSIPLRGGAMAKLGRVLTALDENRLPVHITPPVRFMIEAMASGLPPETSTQFLKLLDPAHTDDILDEMGERFAFLDAVLHNTVNATIVNGGLKQNVIPSEITVSLDIRKLPGQTPDDVLRELRAVIGDDVELEVVYYYDSPPDSDMGLYDTLADILRQADPTGTPTPFIMAAATDGRFFDRLGIQTYGFLPMDLPPDVDLLQAIHAADERIPVATMQFGTDAIYTLLQRFGEG